MKKITNRTTTKIVKNTNNAIERFKSIQDKGLNLYIKKNHDYGDAFAQSLDEDGLLVAKIRLNDKIRRFNALLKSKALVHESMEDTLLDMANYAIMTISWLQSRKKTK